jgi:hypothetical protein
MGSSKSEPLCGSDKGKQSVRNMEGSDVDEKKMEFGFDARANRLNGGRL